MASNNTVTKTVTVLVCIVCRCNICNRLACNQAYNLLTETPGVSYHPMLHLVLRPNYPAC